MTNTSEPSEFWVKAKEIVADAADVASADRAAWVRARCAGDGKLLAEVNSLLSGLTGIDSYIEAPVFAHWPETRGQDLQSGVRLGAYALDQEVGRGGMGVVWAAHRVDGAYQQRVAIKLLVGGNSLRDVRRLERERQWLAQLNHPGIARLLDGGTSPQGTPYLVLEFVEGQSIDQYCAQQGLTVVQRVALVRQVCAAVQSAHQSALIHRDIKPSNILVTAAGETKLLDFGIARLLAEEGAGSDVTLANALPFTPRYASPEQLRGAPVTVATDVHGLGLLLYELLCGASPYRRLDASPDSNLADAVLALSQDDPRAPSVVAQAQGMGSAHVRALRGELDAVLLKACAKTPEARYATVAQLDEDLRRWLDGDAVLARQPTRLHIAAKLLRKHWIASALGVGALVLVVASAVVATLQWQRAEQRYALVRQMANKLIFSYYTDIQPLAGAKPVLHKLVNDALAFVDALGDDHSAATVLERATAYRKISLLLFNGRNISHLGDEVAGRAALAKARQLLEVADQSKSVRHADVQTELARLDADEAALFAQQGKVTESVELLQSAIARLTAVLAQGSGVTEAHRELPQVLLALANVRSRLLGQSSASELNLADSALRAWEEKAPGESEAILVVRHFLMRQRSNNALGQKDWAQAVAFLSEELEAEDDYLRLHPANIGYVMHRNKTLNSRGVARTHLGSYAMAIRDFDRAVVHGEEWRKADPASIEVSANLGRVLFNRARAKHKQNEVSGALADLDLAIKEYERLAGKDVGHYTVRQWAEAYWQSMMWLGQSGAMAEQVRLARQLVEFGKNYPAALSEGSPADWLKEARAVVSEPAIRKPSKPYSM